MPNHCGGGKLQHFKCQVWAGTFGVDNIVLFRYSRFEPLPNLNKFNEKRSKNEALLTLRPGRFDVECG